MEQIVKKGFWALEDILEAKRIVKILAEAGDESINALRDRAKRLMEQVRSNEPVEDLVLPL